MVVYTTIRQKIIEDKKERKRTLALETTNNIPLYISRLSEDAHAITTHV